VTEQKQKRLLVIFGVVAGIFLVTFLFQTRAKKKTTGSWAKTVSISLCIH